MMNDERHDSARHSGPSVMLHIGELVLDGFEGVDGAGVGETVQQELTRLFAERGVPASLRREVTVPALEAGDIRLSAGVEPQELGAQIAEIVYGSWLR